MIQTLGTYALPGEVTTAMGDVATGVTALAALGVTIAVAFVLGRLGIRGIKSFGK
jgi:hypothetical protein